MMRTLPVLQTIILFLYCISLPVLSQQEKKSKVFKPKSASLRMLQVQESDAVYQLWEGFQLMRNANAGDAPSQHELSIRYLTGKGFPYDTLKAAYWMKRAVDQKYILAQFNYGIYLNNGWGVDWNPFLALGYIQAAADREMKEAQYVLGLFYTDNLVLPRNYPTAYQWIKKAAEQGYDPAKDVMKEFVKRGIDVKETRKDSTSPKMAVIPAATVQSTSSGAIQPVMLEFDDDKTAQADDMTLLKDLFNEGNDELRNILGMSKILSDSVATDSTGLALIRTAAEAGNPEAMTIVGRCYEKGIGVKKDDLQAAVAYARAVRLDSRRAPALLWRLVNEKATQTKFAQLTQKKDPAALYVQAALNSLGFAGTLTNEQALQFLQLAVAASYIPAVIDLGTCYSQGQWVKQDKKKAKDFWQYAADRGSNEGKIRVAVANLFEGTLGDAKQAFDMLRTYADEGSVLAQTALGYCYEKGIIVRVDLAQAVSYYRRSGQRGNQAALTALMRLYDDRRPKEKQFQITEE